MADKEQDQRGQTPEASVARAAPEAEIKLHDPSWIQSPLQLEMHAVPKVTWVLRKRRDSA